MLGAATNLGESTQLNQANFASNVQRALDQVSTFLQTGKPSLITLSECSHLFGKCSLTCNRFIYTTFVALDANFRLKRRAISNETRDPSMSAGWGHFIEGSAYREHLKNYVNQDDVSSFCLPLLLRNPLYTHMFVIDKHMYGLCGTDACQHLILQGLHNHRLRDGNQCATWFHLAERSRRPSKG